MAITSPAYVIQASSHSAELFREAIASHIVGSGVVNSGDLAVSQNGTPNMSVNVAAGQVWIPGTLSSSTGFSLNQGNQSSYGLPTTFNEQGCYYAWNNGTVNLTAPASDPTNPRIDIVCASVQDAQYSGSNNQAILQYISGTPAASPSPPAAPATTVVLAQVAVAATATSIVNANITDERPKMGVGPIRSDFRAEMYRTAAFASIGTSDTQVPFDTIAYDPNGNCTTGASALYTCPVAGVYLTATGLSVTTNTLTLIRLYKNASFFRQPYNVIGSSLPSSAASAGTTVLCNAGDTLAYWCRSSASSSSLAVGQASCWASFTLLLAT